MVILAKKLLEYIIATMLSSLSHLKKIFVNKKKDILFALKLIGVSILIAIFCQRFFFEPQAKSEFLVRVPSMILVPVGVSQNCISFFSQSHINYLAGKFNETLTSNLELKKIAMDTTGKHCIMKIKMQGSEKEAHLKGLEGFVDFLKEQSSSLVVQNADDLKAVVATVTKEAKRPRIKPEDNRSDIRDIEVLQLKLAINYYIKELENPKYTIIAHIFESREGWLQQTIKFILMGVLLGLFLFSFLSSVAVAVK